LDTVFDLLRQLAGQSGGPTIGDSDNLLTPAQLFARINDRAGRLRGAGVERGDRVLVACANSIEWIVSALAVMRLGAIAAPINPQATAREVRIYEGIIEPRGTIVDKEVDSGKFDRVLAVPYGTTAEPSDAGLPKVPAGSDRALILFTSGTTGIPKAAVQSHRALVLSGEGFVHWLGLSSHDRVLIIMPLFHANAIYYSLMGGLCAAADIVISPRFSASGFWPTAVAANATQANLMGPMLSILLKQPDGPAERTHKLRTVYTAAAAEEVMNAARKRFGIEVIEGYGLTETAYGCINPKGAGKPGSIGKPRQHPKSAISNEIAVADGLGRFLGVGETGEIVIRNGAMMLEYWNNPEATTAAFRDGWFRTGDFGYRDQDGYFFIVGRLKEMIRRKGVNIAPREIELVMGQLPGVDEAAVVGLPSPIGEELVIAVVTLAPGNAEQGADRRILARLATLLSREKLPDEVVVAERLPKTPTHRVEKAKLREWLLRRPHQDSRSEQSRPIEGGHRDG
jgi:crotonobetaine/carnitine-CoA ligase